MFCSTRGLPFIQRAYVIYQQSLQQGELMVKLFVPTSVIKGSNSNPLIRLPCHQPPVYQIMPSGAEAGRIGGEEVDDFGNFFGVAGSTTGVEGVFVEPVILYFATVYLNELLKEVIDQGGGEWFRHGVCRHWCGCCLR